LPEIVTENNRGAIAEGEQQMAVVKFPTVTSLVRRENESPDRSSVPATAPVALAIGQAQHKAVIELAAKMGDWATLTFAVNDMIVDQHDFVRWWGLNVGVRQGLNRFSIENADRGSLSLAEAEQLTGVSQQKVSRWRKALGIDRDHLEASDAAVEVYRESIIRAARKKAGFELNSKDPMAARGQPNRDGPDYWGTPSCLVAALIQHVIRELPPGSIWEPASGDGRLVRTIAATGRVVFGSALYPQDGAVPLGFLNGNPPVDMADAIAVTNPPYSKSDEFLWHGLDLLAQGKIRGLVLLLRHDHLMASSRAPAFNRAIRDVQCCWRPIWIPNSFGNPRWSFHWVSWHDGPRQPPLYLTEADIRRQ
jgi:hypothetical protein